MCQTSGGKLGPTFHGIFSNSCFCMRACCSVFFSSHLCSFVSLLSCITFAFHLHICALLCISVSCRAAFAWELAVRFSSLHISYSNRLSNTLKLILSMGSFSICVSVELLLHESLLFGEAGGKTCCQWGIVDGGRRHQLFYTTRFSYFSTFLRLYLCNKEMCISDLCIYVFVNREGYLMSERDDNSFAKLFFPLLTLSPAYFLLFSVLYPQLYFVFVFVQYTKVYFWFV